MPRKKKEDLERMESPCRLCLESLSIPESFECNSNISCQSGSYHSRRYKQSCTCKEIKMNGHYNCSNCLEKSRRHGPFELQDNSSNIKCPSLIKGTSKDFGKLQRNSGSNGPNNPSIRSNTNYTSTSGNTHGLIADERNFPIPCSSCNKQSMVKKHLSIGILNLKDASTTTSAIEITFPFSKNISQQPHPSPFIPFCMSTPAQVPNININLPIGLIPGQEISVSARRNDQANAPESQVLCPSCSNKRISKSTGNPIENISNNIKEVADSPSKLIDSSNVVTAKQNDLIKTPKTNNSAPTYNRKKILKCNENHMEGTSNNIKEGEILPPKSTDSSKIATLTERNGQKVSPEYMSKEYGCEKSGGTHENDLTISRSSIDRRSESMTTDIALVNNTNFCHDCCQRNSVCRSSSVAVIHKKSKECSCPPSFNQFGCTGNISGNCNCIEN